MWRNPFDELRRMQMDIDRMFSDFFSMPSTTTALTPTSAGWREPLTDMWEDENNVVVTAELPGINKEDIKLNVTEDTLEIKVERKREKREETETSKRMERSYTGFYRYLQLPAEVLPDKATATYNNGVLEVKIPKVEKARKRGKEIKVQ